VSQERVKRRTRTKSHPLTRTPEAPATTITPSAPARVSAQRRVSAPNGPRSNAVRVTSAPTRASTRRSGRPRAPGRRVARVNPVDATHARNPRTSADAIRTLPGNGQGNGRRVSARNQPADNAKSRLNAIHAELIRPPVLHTPNGAAAASATSTRRFTLATNVSPLVISTV